jgi:glycosyltransferase involved in cell wall biosynthesis
VRTIVYLNYTSIEQARQLNQLGSYLRDICSDRAGAFDRVVAILFPSGRRGYLRLAPHVELFDFDVPEVFGLKRSVLGGIADAMRGAAYFAFVVWIVTRYRPALIEATEPYVRGLMALMVSRLMRVPFAVQGSRDFDLDHALTGVVAGGRVFRSRTLAKWVERLVFRNADVLIADRRFYARYMLANGGRADRLVLGHVVVDSAYYSSPASRADPRPSLGLPQRPALLYVGRLAEDKRVLDLVHCLAEIRATHDVDLVLAGDGPLQHAMASLAEDLGVREHVHFVGPLSLDALPALMTSSAVILGPHMGLTLVEAALSGTPIVAYDWEWHGEVLTDGTTGRLVPFGDWRAMAAATVELLDDGQLGARLAAAARERCLSEHVHADVMQTYRQGIERLIGSYDGRPIDPR